MDISFYKPSNKFGSIIFAFVLLLALLNIFTPLRLNTDGIRYLNIVEYLKGNLDNSSTAAHDYLPHGYPWFLFILDKLHILGPISITLINIFSTLIAGYLTANLLNIKDKLPYLSLLLISFINIKHFTLPVSDQFFTLVFITAIYLWNYCFKGKLLLGIPAIIFTLLSIYLRTAGITVVIGIALYFCYLNIGVLLKKRALIIILVILLIGLFGAFIINLRFLEGKVDYLRQLDLELMVKNPLSIYDRLIAHIREFGELVFNIPTSKLSSLLPVHLRSFDIAIMILVMVGGFLVYMLFLAIKNLKLYWLLIFWVCVSYMMMIFLWPFYDARFLMPVVPFCICLFFYYIFTFFKPAYIRFIAVGIYIVFGLTGMAYSDALSLNKSFFLSHYGFDPQLTRQYQTHFNNEKVNKAARPVYDIKKNNVPYLLEYYDHDTF